MSAVPFATSGECETMTMPTLSFISCASPFAFQTITDRGDDQRARPCPRVHMAYGPLSQKRRPALDGLHRDRRLGPFLGQLSHAVKARSAIAQMFCDRPQHVEHGLVVEIGLAARLDGLD